jgi:hypothetical protein
MGLLLSCSCRTTTPSANTLMACRIFTQDLYDETKKDGWIVISMKNDWKRLTLRRPYSHSIVPGGLEVMS